MMKTRREREDDGSRSGRWLPTAFLLIGCPIMAVAGDGYELKTGKIVAVSGLGGHGDAGYALSHLSLQTGTQDPISPTARLVACMYWENEALPIACKSADLVADGVVDLRDFARLQNGFRNPIPLP